MNSLSLNWTLLPELQPFVDEYSTQADWHKLCLRASNLNNGRPCELLKEINAGLNHIVRLLRFQDSNTLWIVRIPVERKDVQSKQAHSSRIQAEVDVMRLLHERTNIGVPRIFDYEPTANNPTGLAFIMMEFLPGNVAMDLFGGWASHHGEIPSEHRRCFYSSVSKMQVELTSVRFPKIGIVRRDADGGYDVGPLPDIGGPFDSAASFVTAWAQHARFPSGSLDVLAQMEEAEGGAQHDVAREVRDSVRDFPARLKAMIGARQIILKDGPFPVCHTDLMHSNIVVDNDYKVLGIIDWEGACTLPWELVEYPLFLDALPPVFDAPDQYDARGEPLDADTRQCWRERGEYLEMVRLAEEGEGFDHCLSDSLADWKVRGLGYAIRVFDNPGIGLNQTKVVQSSLGLF
ncbi:kinase-like domain-containing protein [Nemania sp. NC0429]|nr:kinase-like domain-containing protein [Nemania sp. NC0429]